LATTSAAVPHLKSTQGESIDMKPRKLFVTAIGMAIALIASACSGSPGSTPPAETGPLTIWLMNGSAPQSVIDGVNADFKAKHPNVTVNVEIQQWSDVGTKLDTAFAGSTPPDVMELGNTLVAKYAAAGALQDIGSKKSSYDNSATWLQSLTDSCTLAGKLYCVPYYAGSRAVIYRKDLFDAAGVQLLSIAPTAEVLGSPTAIPFSLNVRGSQ